MPEHNPPPASEILLYQAKDGRSRIEVRLEGETVWLTINKMAELFQVHKSSISRHLKNIYEEGELEQAATVAKIATVQNEGGRSVSRDLEYYNLDAILSVGYRVNSAQGTQFRIWATQRLREYIVKGFALDDERLKGGDRLADYFDELLSRIREIRASEQRVYQRIREIFALAADYQEGQRETRQFFAMMQNKMHFAATGLTAAEIVRRRADAGQANMGLKSWAGSRVCKRDVPTAKNYLEADEIDTLNRIVVMFLDQAEFRAQRRQNIRMGDWAVFLDQFLANTELPVLDGVGGVSHAAAQAWAEDQYDHFAERRRLQAEQESEAQYFEDLKTSAKALESGRKR